MQCIKVARGILNNDEDAADAIQDTNLTCFEKLHTLKKPEYFKTWMIRILINECNSIRRHYSNLNLQEDFADIPQSDVSIAEFEFKEMLETVDEKYRVVLILHYVEGFKLSEIAAILELNENTVKTRIARARQQLREAYADTLPASPRKVTYYSDADRKGEGQNEQTERFHFIRSTFG